MMKFVAGLVAALIVPGAASAAQEIDAQQRLRLAGVECLRLFWPDRLQNVVIAQLQSADANTRLVAVEAIGCMAKRKDRHVHEALLQHLRDEDRHVRRAVYEAVARVGADGAADVLVNALQFDDGRTDFLRDGLVRAIEGLGQPGIARLLALADSGEKKDTDLVAEVFMSLRTPPAALALPELLKNYHLSKAQKDSLMRSLKNYRLEPERLISWLDAKDATFRLGVIREIVDRRAVQAIPRLERLARESTIAEEVASAKKAVNQLRVQQDRKGS